jgi:hypothetical protein
MDYYGTGETVRIAMDGRCALNDNRATSLLPTDAPVVLIAARAIIMNANYLFGPVAAGNPKYNPDTRIGGGAKGLFVAGLTIRTGPLAVMGNITSAPIVIDGGRLLPAPWFPLNVISP